MTLLSGIRRNSSELDESDIVAIANSSREKEGIIPLWVGEGDRPTPKFIMDAAKQSMNDGETFYTWQRGIPDLRQALADYHENIYGIANNPERFFVTGSGMQAIQITLQALAGHGDEVIMPTPTWPNFHAATQVMGATPVHVEMDFSENGWGLDTQKLFDAVGPNTRAIFFNSPSNPTGWVASRETLMDILTFARERGIWIIADEVYSRFSYDALRAPSFYDLIDDQDRVIFVNTFSKNWAMTGWRAGWISAPQELGQIMENLIQYSTSGVPTFTQRAAAIALRKGEAFLDEQKQLAYRNRDHLCNALLDTGKVQFAKPQGAFYLFFAVSGFQDSRKLALQLVDEANVGLAPGTGFYTKHSHFLRLCYLRAENQIEEATNRLVDWLE